MTFFIIRCWLHIKQSRLAKCKRCEKYGSSSPRTNSCFDISVLNIFISLWISTSLWKAHDVEKYIEWNCEEMYKWWWTQTSDAPSPILSSIDTISCLCVNIKWGKERILQVIVLYYYLQVNRPVSEIRGKWE